jgi:ATP-dependent DNA ligase
MTDDASIAVFELIRRRLSLCAFDLLELDGDDLRRLPIATRKRRLAKLLKGASSNIALNEHFDGDGEIVFKQACKLARYQRQRRSSGVSTSRMV